MAVKIDGLPDVNVLLEIEVHMAKLYYSNTNLILPAIRERLLDLTDSVKAGNDSMRKNVVSSLVALNLDLESDAADQDEEDLLRLRQGLLADMKSITKAVRQVSDYRAPDVKGVRRAHDELVEKTTSSVAKLEQMVQEERERLAEIDEQLKTLEHPSVIGVLRNLIPQEKDIDTLLRAIKDPRVSPELVKMALERLNKQLDLFEQGRKFSDVVAARGRLAGRVNEQKETLRAVQKQLAEAQQKSGQYDDVETLLMERAPWVEQANKFVSHWQMLSRAIEASVQLPVLHSALEEARDYLLALRRRFEMA